MTFDVSRPRRSVLYMPASNARALAKARALDCDVVVLDLEDAVAPEAKANAREAAVAASREGGFGARELVVRINALDTPWGVDDLAAVAGAGFDAVLAPKVSSPEMVAEYDRGLGGDLTLWVMIETAAALFALEPIAASARTTRLGALVIGANDLAKETGWRLTPVRAPFAPMLAASVAAARLHGLAALDAVSNDLQAGPAFEAECAQGVEFGFDGKTLIHPNQIAGANRLFSPSAEEVARARAVIDAFADPLNAGQGALRVDGRMVERLHLAQALKLIAAGASVTSR